MLDFEIVQPAKASVRIEGQQEEETTTIILSRGGIECSVPIDIWQLRRLRHDVGVRLLEMEYADLQRKWHLRQKDGQ